MIRSPFAYLAPATLVALTLAVPISARADADAGARALAVQLFDEGEALFGNGQTAEACPKYAESYRLDPQLGVLVYLAECFEKNGQLASAWGSFREAEEIARKRGDARGDSARERAAALEPRLSYLTIQVPTKARLAGLEVLRDGALVAPVLWGARAAIDAGQHRLEVRAPGHKPWWKDVAITGEASAQSVEVPALQRDPIASAPTQIAPASPGSARRIAALAVGGLGIVGVGVGGFFGLSAQASLSDSKDYCNDGNYCTPRGDEFRQEAKDKALVATITAGVGIAALGGAAVLWFTAPKAEQVGTKSSPSSRERAWALAPSRRGWGLEVHREF